ncbi:hypothetical protein [Leptospira idonii]|uniref:Uncharacterized protein n=1 Tax=Leptospira idonii TaxID=1193500 RepID=A0A4R9M488_9LEPT|nr:hypothetical protein [Leptospira idonii]TGN20791.1 hypothetical protein EHS15_01780 [Leptospira idonii]
MFVEDELNLQLFGSSEVLPVEVFEWKDPETQKVFQIPLKIKTGSEEIDMKVVIGHLNSGIRKVVTREVRAKAESKVKELKAILAEKEIFESDLTEKAKGFEKEVHRLADLYRETKIEKDILEAMLFFMRNDAEERVNEFKSKSSSLLKEEDGFYKTVVKLKEMKQEFSAKEAVEYCFADISVKGIENTDQ